MTKFTMLPNDMSINHIESLLSLLNSSEVGDFAHGKLDGSQVEKVSTAGIQTIIAFYQTLLMLDGKLTLKTPSDALVQSMQLLGLTGLLQQWSTSDE